MRIAAERRFVRSVLLGSALLAGGCAFGDRTVTLTYPPPAHDSGEPATATASAPQAPSPHAAVVLRPFGDQRRRTNTSSIGEVRNGWGIPTAEVVAEGDVIAWVMKGIEAELAARGLRVLRDGPPGEPDLPVLSGDVLTVYATAVFAYDGKVEFSVTLRQADQALLQQQYRGSGGAGAVWAATAESYGESLGIALQDAARKLASDVVAVVGRR
jgi:hypothetical protein